MLERKGLPLRLAAWAIDAAIVAIVWQILYAILKPKEPSFLATGTTFQDIMDYAYTLWGRRWWTLGIAGLAMGAVELFMGQTPGKMILKMKILGENQQPIGPDKLAIRVAVKYGVFVLYTIMGFLTLEWMMWINHILMIGLFGSIFMLTMPARQTLPDIVAKTGVFGPPGPATVGFNPVMPGQPYPPQGYPGQPMPPAGTSWAPPGPTVPPGPGMAPPPMGPAPTGQQPMPPPQA